MALPKAKIELKYVVKKDDPRRLAERFAGRVAFPNVKALAQQAVGYDRERNFLNEISQNSVYDQAVYRDVQKRIKSVGLEKENTLRMLAGAQSEEERDFYNQKLKVLDNLLNELKTDLNRASLSMDYLYDLESAGNLAKSRQDEIASSIYGQPPAMGFTRFISPIQMPKVEKTEYITGSENETDSDNFGEMTGFEDPEKRPSPTAPEEDDMTIATRERDRLYDDYRFNRISYPNLKKALESIRSRYKIRNNRYFQLKSFLEKVGDEGMEF